MADAGLSMPMHQGRVLPSISFSQLDLPEVLSWDVGEEYFLTIRVKMTGRHNMNFLEDAPKADKEKMTGDFQILAVSVPGEKDQISLAGKAFERKLARAKSGK